MPTIVNFLSFITTRRGRSSSLSSTSSLSSSPEQQPLLHHRYRRRIQQQQQQEQKRNQNVSLPIFDMTVWTIAAALLSCLGGFLFGFDLGVVGGLFIAPSFQTHFGIDPNDKIREADINGNIVAVLQIGCLVGSLAATTTADKLGRKWSITIAAAIFTLGGILQIIGDGLSMLYAGRLIAGFGVGAMSMLVPVYVAEIAHQNQRGVLGGLWQFFIAAGLAMSYWTNYAVQSHVNHTDNALWRIPLIVQLVPGVIMLIGMPFLFETPRCLCAQEKVDRARVVVSRIRGLDVNDPKVEKEIQQIQSGILLLQESLTNAASRRGGGKLAGWRLVFSKQNRRRLLIGSALQMFQQLTGTNIINYFSPQIYRSIGLSSNTAELLATGVYGLVKMSVTLIGFSCLVDRYGRRKLLIGGGVAQSLSLISVAICAGVRPPSTMTDGPIHPASYAAIAFLYIFAVFFSMSWGPIPWLYCSEIYPMWMRAKSTAVTTAINWILNAAVGKFSPLLLVSSTWGTFVFYGLWNVVMAVFCLIFVPETKGKTLEEMDMLFSYNRSVINDGEESVISEEQLQPQEERIVKSSQSKN
ncbi:general substrate transporter [Phascolomyces articulosus]|uniref:General substrate transporter n=1 Tax=Phascolomyces articulosus TaxID=60185 RepID=A0AAD5JPJ7_9FUNG|nr:general substrate transporter [Phascolomyces articulosus]